MGEMVYDTKQPWRLIGDITSSKSALAVTGRQDADVKAFASGSYVLWNAPPEIGIAEFRFSTDADGDSQVVNVYASRGANDYVLVGTLTLTGGTQTGPNSNVYVDTIVESDIDWLRGSATRVCRGSGSNHQARWIIDLMGYSRILFIATTLASSTTLRVEGSGV